MKLFDSHSHLHDDKFEADRPAAIDRALDAGVTRILTLGDSLFNSRRAVALAESHPAVLAACGIHPSHARSWEPETARDLAALLDHPRVPVLGEIGLDYYWDKTPEFVAIQHVAFREQLNMARERGLPVSIHSRESNGDVLRLLEEERGAEIGGVLHCFHGSYGEMRRGLDMGFYIGVGGSSTYPKSADHRELLKRIGVQHLLLETDAPYLPPQPQRGKRNEPAFVAATCRIVAAALGIDPEQLAAQAFENTCKAFRLKQHHLS